LDTRSLWRDSVSAASGDLFWRDSIVAKLAIQRALAMSRISAALRRCRQEMKPTLSEKNLVYRETVPTAIVVT